MARTMVQLDRRIQSFLATIKKRPDLANKVICATFPINLTDLCDGVGADS